MEIRKCKRTLAILLVTAMCLLLVACSGAPAQETPTANPDAPPAQSADSPPSAPDPEEPFAEQRTISLAVLDNVTDDQWENEYHQYFMKKFNIQWDYNYVEWSSWQEKLRVWINSGDLPDVSIWDYNYPDAFNYVEQELLFRFPDDWKQRWPNAAAAFASSPLNTELEQRFGGTYIMLRPIYVFNKPSEPIANQIGVIALRKDWAEAVGFALKDAYTVNEIIEYGRLIHENDPGQVGADLIPLCFDPANAMTCLVSANADHTREDAFYKDENGVYQWGPAQESTLEALKIYQQVYNEGLLSPEFYLMNDDDKDKFYVTGTAALYHIGGVADFRQIADTEMRNNLQIDSDEVIHEAIVLGNDQKYHNLILGANYWSSLIFSPNITLENFERIMDLIDYTCTKEGQIVANMGFEGVDWELNADGEPVSTLPEDFSLLDKYGARIESIYILEDDFAIINPAIKKAYRTRMQQLAADKVSYAEGVYSDFDWDMELFTSKAKSQAPLDYLVYATDYANLIVQSGDLETNWIKWKESKLPLVQPYLDELNALNP